MNSDLEVGPATIESAYAAWHEAHEHLNSARNAIAEAQTREQAAREALRQALDHPDGDLRPPPVGVPPVAAVPINKTDGRIPTGLAQSVVSFLDGKDWMRIAEVVAQVLPRVEADGHRTTADTLRGTVRTLRKNKILKDRDRGQDGNGQKIIEVRLA